MNLSDTTTLRLQAPIGAIEKRVGSVVVVMFYNVLGRHVGSFVVHETESRAPFPAVGRVVVASSCDAD